jgi:glycosyltransferase involved in cell wall biosynthesis
MWFRSEVNSNLRKELGLEGAFPVVGYVGRIAEEKELGNWVRVAQRVAMKYQNARFVIVGEGRDNSIKTDLDRLAQALGITDRMVFLGYREDLVPIYAMFDVFLLTSSREGLCNSILEAMSLGVPVVSTDVGGSRELVVHEQTGFLLNHGDIEGIASAVLALIENEPLRLRMGQAGRERIDQEFSFGSRLRKVEDLYEELIAHRGV